MAKNDVVARQKESYKDLSDDELLNIVHSVVPHASRHIAAKQEIEDRKRDFSSRQYETEKSTNKLTKYILALTIILLVFAAAQLAYSFGAFSADSVIPVNTPSTIDNAKDAKNTNNVKKDHNIINTNHVSPQN